MKTALPLIAALLLGPVALAAQPPATQPADREKLEKEFAEKLTGATLVGHFTMDGREGVPREERYSILSVKKLAGDMWVFTARVQYGKKDVTVPIPLPIKWAGDTPVITLTDATIPGLGTYTARVMFYKDQYAGTWSGGDHGGHLWGRIERAGAKAGEAKPGDTPAGGAVDKAKE